MVIRGICIPFIRNHASGNYSFCKLVSQISIHRRTENSYDRQATASDRIDAIKCSAQLNLYPLTLPLPAAQVFFSDPGSRQIDHYGPICRLHLVFKCHIFKRFLLSSVYDICDTRIPVDAAFNPALGHCLRTGVPPPTCGMPVPPGRTQLAAASIAAHSASQTRPPRGHASSHSVLCLPGQHARARTRRTHPQVSRRTWRRGL